MALYKLFIIIIIIAHQHKAAGVKTKAKTTAATTLLLCYTLHTSMTFCWKCS